MKNLKSSYLRNKKHYLRCISREYTLQLNKFTGTCEDAEDSLPACYPTVRKMNRERCLERKQRLIHSPPPATLFNLDTIDSKGHTTSVQLSPETRRSHGMNGKGEKNKEDFILRSPIQS